MLKNIYAKYILTGTGLIENGILIIDNAGKISSIKKDSKKNTLNTLIIPGFINAHTHTDLTIDASENTPRIFSEWVLSLVKKRNDFDENTINDLRNKAFKSIIKSGTTSICDIIPPLTINNRYLNSDCFNNNGTFAMPRIKGYIEIIGLDTTLADKKIKDFKAVRSLLLKNNISKNSFSVGISPHSIYSVSKELFQKIVKENKKWKMDVAIHVCENQAEIAFISEGAGDISEKLLPGLNLAEFKKPEQTYSSPIFYLSFLKIIDSRTSLIHANEIKDKDIEIIKNSQSSIIHCPRSNGFFNSNTLPLRKLLDQNINVCLGTDSLYSNSSLSMLDELKFSKKIHQNVSSKELFFIATKNGAKVLNINHVTGTLEKWSFADFIIFKLPSEIKINEQNVYDKILDFNDNDISNVFISGKEVLKNNH